MVISHFSDFVASVTDKNYQRHKIICGMHPVGCQDRSIDQSEDVFVEYPVCVISVAVLAAVVNKAYFC